MKFESEVWMEFDWHPWVNLNNMVYCDNGYAICYDAKENTSPEDYELVQKTTTFIDELQEEHVVTYYEATLKTQ